jgi:tRNA-splicing ligase RtcB
LSIRLERGPDEYTWIIPKGARPGMRTDVVVFGDEFLIKKMKEDITLIQGANVATLPGVVGKVYIMPDGHQGYGFPIGGVAAFDVNEGIISPGGVGYDINCLAPDTKVLDEYGAWRYIKDLRIGNRVLVNDGRARGGDVIYWFYRPENRIYVIKTRSGLVIRATDDHPILTNRGMILAKNLKKGDRVATYPFEGVRYEEPPKKLLLDESDFSPGISRELRKRGLLPLYTDNPKLPLILKLLGYFTGDGAFDGKKTCFYGGPEGLEEIAMDIKRLGYTPTRIINRKRVVAINGKRVVGVENGICVSARSFRLLLEKLGAPVGNRVKAPFIVPEWIMELPAWMKRLYVAAYFGAKMFKPQTINGYSFKQPFVSIKKVKELENIAMEFLRGIAEILKELGIEILSIDREDLGDRVRLKLRISSKPEVLIKLWSRVGYIYNPTRHRAGLAAVSWLRWKMRVFRDRSKDTEIALASHRIGISPSGSIALLSGGIYRGNRRLLERSTYNDLDEVRVPKNFPRFEEWYRENISNDIVWDVIEEILAESYNGHVYDITVNDEAHNFVANGFVVSNCGVRLMRTNLMEKNVRPKLKELVDTLFENIPSGVGAEGKIRVGVQDINEILGTGVDWAIRKGFGWADDKYHIESRGFIDWANPDKVSKTAKDRGKEQLGTLGAGNHFLEVQVVDKIYDPAIAKKLGIEEEGQVVVMAHCGSRGLGHQVASDYLMIMERAMRKYGVNPPDRELASVPFNTKEAQDYFQAMGAAANFAFTNRQLITHWVRESFRQVFHVDPDKLDLQIIYDVAHNIAKIEEYEIEGKRRKVVVHRKGATRAFPPGHPEIPREHQETGQVVLIPGSMGSGSFMMVGIPESIRTFYSAPHGAGRWMSRAGAVRSYPANQVINELSKRGIYVRAVDARIVSEEAPGAYKDVDKVALVADRVKIAKLVARLRPIGVAKG